jgi:RNA polymerase sigma-70 factor (ECF subfamily)
VTSEPTLDVEVAPLLAARDFAGATCLVLRRLGPRILNYLRTILRNETDATDAFGQFAENLWRGIASFRGHSSLKVWAFRLAWNAALSLRAEAWRRHVRRLDTAESSQIAEEVRNLTAIRMEHRRRAIDQLRQELSPEEQTLLSLRLDQDLTWPEIAEVLSAGEPVDAVTLRKRFERLKERLGAMARERGILD